MSRTRRIRFIVIMWAFETVRQKQNKTKKKRKNEKLWKKRNAILLRRKNNSRRFSYLVKIIWKKFIVSCCVYCSNMYVMYTVYCTLYTTHCTPYILYILYVLVLYTTHKHNHGETVRDSATETRLDSLAPSRQACNTHFVQCSRYYPLIIRL